MAGLWLIELAGCWVPVGHVPAALRGKSWKQRGYGIRGSKARRLRRPVHALEPASTRRLTGQHIRRETPGAGGVNAFFTRIGLDTGHDKLRVSVADGLASPNRRNLTRRSLRWLALATTGWCKMRCDPPGAVDLYPPSRRCRISTSI
jgi:hypothetical protein